MIIAASEPRPRERCPTGMRLGMMALAFVVSSALAQGARLVAPLPAKDMRPGYGVVESMTPVRVAAERSAAAGGSAATKDAARPMYRVAVRMADGKVQYRDLDHPEFKAGDHVLLTNAGDVLPD